MSALTFGITAALCWGIHDVCVRYLSQRVSIYSALFLVLLTGTILLAPVMLSLGSTEFSNPQVVTLSAASGLAFAWTGLSLYKAFSLGPVWLAAPIIGAFPILSMGWAAFSGSPITLLQWAAVLAVIGGVAVVATQSRDDTPFKAPRYVIILWSIGSAIGWAVTFAFGQAATQYGDPYDVLFVTRIFATLALIPVLLIVKAGLRISSATFAMVCILGLLDATALFLVIQSGTMDRPEYASVAASTFGVITILLAWAFLGEQLRLRQWIGVFIAFAAIGYLAI